MCLHSERLGLKASFERGGPGVGVSSVESVREKILQFLCRGQRLDGGQGHMVRDRDTWWGTGTLGGGLGRIEKGRGGGWGTIGKTLCFERLVSGIYNKR